MSVHLPESLLVLERGWLSANSIVLFDGGDAVVVDSGYVTHASQTVELVDHAVRGRHLKRLINTHSHSDHIGGNAALQARFGCEIIVPAGLHATIAEWDEDALLLSPLGQQAARFQHDSLIRAGEVISMGDLDWQALAVPGHDMEALAFYNPDRRILISGDALWENGFGVIFPELLGEADGIAITRDTLEMLSRLPIDIVIPGHGSPFTGVEGAFERAFRRIDSFAADIDKLAWNAIKVLVSFAMLEIRRLPAEEFPAFVLGLPFAISINIRYLNLSEDELVERIKRELLLVNAMRREVGFLVAG